MASKTSKEFTGNATASNTARYSEYAQDHNFEYDDGLVVMPLAQSTPGHRLIRIHGGVGMRVVRWKAERVGQPPTAPAHANTLGDTILSSSVHAALPLPQPQSGTYLFKMWGEYRYVQNEPRIVGTNSLPTGAHPYPVEPMDSMAQAAAGSTSTSAAPLDTLAAYDAEVNRITDRIATGGTFSWPITVIPAYFTAHTIAG